jgi:deazaflavin-dependent oxidoreductase (nitroreductase family)
VLETVGRHSGRGRHVVLVYLRDGSDLVVVPANAGAATAPSWWLNLQASGTAVATVDGHRLPVSSAVIDGQRRERLWRRFAEFSPLEHYQQQTARALPLVALVPLLSGQHHSAGQPTKRRWQRRKLLPSVLARGT